MLNAYFISDVHATDWDSPRGAALLKFLDELIQKNECTHLFLVGDIFDLWLAEHEVFLKKHSVFIEKIRKLLHQNVEIHYFEGNHDLYLKSFWAQTLGVYVHEGPERFQLGPFQVRVEHGDQMDPEDKGYLFLRWLLRTPMMTWLGKNLPGFVVNWIGEKASQKSRYYTSHVKTLAENDKLQKMRKYARKMIQQVDFDYLISGHTHVEDDFSFEYGERKIRAINLGSWFDGFKALRLQAKGVEWVTLS